MKGDKPKACVPVDEDDYPLNVRDLPPNYTNPFMEEDLSTNIYVGSNIHGRKELIAHTNQGIISAEDGGELPGQNIFFYQEKIVDNARFTKVYHDKVKEIAGIGDSASKLYLIVQKMLPVDKDKIYMSPDAGMNYMGVSKRTYHRALRDLLKARLIAKADRRNLYYINPFKLFNGNRASFIQTYINEDSLGTDKLFVQAQEQKGISPNLNFDSHEEIE